MFNIVLFIFFIMVYIHIYLHFKINPLNEMSTITDYCKQEVSNTCYYKLPYIITNAPFINDFDLSCCTKIKNEYIKEYTSIEIIEPYVKFFTNNTVHKIKKDKILELHSNLECRNFYIVHKGSIEVTCIHPKYKEHFKNVTSKTYSFIENHKNMIHLTLNEKDLLFLPNYWFIYIKSNDKNTIIEHIKYSTILNKFTIYWHKHISKYFTNI